MEKITEKAEEFMVEIPADFPRKLPNGSVTGVQPKLLVRQVGDRYLDGWTDEELKLRHENCEDLAQQFAGYCRRKAVENPEWSCEFNVNRAATGLAQKVRSGAWDITPDEEKWIISRFQIILDW